MRTHVLLVFVLAQSLCAQGTSSSESELTGAAEDLWRSAAAAIEAHGDERAVAVFPLISPPRGMTSARIVGASDFIHERITLPAKSSAAPSLGNRILRGNDLVEAMRKKGLDQRSYCETIRADFIGSALNVSYVVTGEFRYERGGRRKPARITVVLTGFAPGVDTGRFSRTLVFERPDGFLRQVATREGTRTTSGFELGKSASPPVFASTSELLQRVLVHRAETYRRVVAHRTRAKVDGASFVVPIRSRGSRRITELSRQIEKNLLAAFPLTIGCEELDRLLAEKFQTGVLYYENEPLEGYLLRELAHHKRFTTTGVFGATSGEYEVSGNRLKVFLKFRGGVDLDAAPSEFEFYVDYPQLRGLLGSLDEKPNRYTFTKRTMKVEDEFQRLARMAVREVMEDFRRRGTVAGSGGTPFDGKNVYVTEPRLPALNPVLSIAGAMLDSLSDTHAELLNRAKEEPEKYKVQSDILVEVPVKIYGGTFASWKSANEEIKKTMTFVFGQKKGVLLQFNVQDMLRAEIQSYAKDIGARGLDAPDPNARTRRTSGALGGRGRRNRRANREVKWDYELQVELSSAGGDRMDVRANLYDWNSEELLAASRTYTVKQYFVKQGNLKFVEPETVAREDLPDEFLKLLERYKFRIPLLRAELEAR